MELEETREGHYLFTSQSFTEGHPDKLCDLISDSILDECLKQDPYSKVAIETIAKANTIVLVGEVTTNAKIDYDKIVKDRLKEIGYDSDQKGLNYKSCEIIKIIEPQSQEISQAVHDNKKGEEDIGAGDQGIMFGYATNETEELFPFSHLMALRLCSRLTEARKNKEIRNLRPDGKAQVTVEYKEEKGKIIPLKIKSIIISTRYEPDAKYETIVEDIKKLVIEKVIKKDKIDDKTEIKVNPIKEFSVGGPEERCGLTGRKIIADTYGGWGAHGGGAFSGKDPTKVDRSGAYAARWISKSLVSANLCDRVLVQISYSIGMSEPLSLFVNSYGTVKKGLTDNDLVNIVKKNFMLKPSNIINELKLRTPLYLKTASGGHFGREGQGFPWENPKKLKI